MADQQLPTVVEVAAPTVIISNSSESENDGGLDTDTSEITAEHSGNVTDEVSEFSGTGTDSGLPSHHSGEPTSDGASSNVAIAEIEAGRDIALAEISAQIERERIEQQPSIGELEECRNQIAELREMVQEIQNSLTPPPQPEAETVTEELQTVPETDLTQPSTAAPTLETMTEPSAESVEENPAVEQTTVVVRRFTAI